MAAGIDDELRVIQTLNRLQADEEIKDYALFGASAITYWAEPVATGDLDYVIEVESDSEYIDVVFQTIGPESDGLEAGGHGLLFGETPVQFFPSTTKPIYAHALEHAVEQHIPLGDGSTITTRVVKPEHLILFGLEVWRDKDKARIPMLRRASNEQEIQRLIEQFDDQQGTYRKRYRSLTG